MDGCRISFAKKRNENPARAREANAVARNFPDPVAGVLIDYGYVTRTATIEVLER
jgi:hypothetical protein